MPRIRPRDIWQARAINKALLALLPVCRDIGSARNELRWLKEHAVAVSHQRTGHHSQANVLSGLVRRRALGEPLQYILGSEYFGALEIKCRHGVLIPRPETAASTSHLARLISSLESSDDSQDSPLRVLDLCTGSGAIPLLFHHTYYSDSAERGRRLELVGVDISSDALSLARENLIHQIAQQGKHYANDKGRTRSLQSMGFVQADVLGDYHDTADARNPLALREALERLHSDTPSPSFDIVISNPPYISPASFQSTTARSVRQFEPKLALVPPMNTSLLSDTDLGDQFYPKLLDAAEDVHAKVVLFEVADMEQAGRVATMAVGRGVWQTIEIWRDEPSAGTEQDLIITGARVLVRGAGHGRSVLAYRAGSNSQKCLAATDGAGDK
ncbi:Putative DNA methylase, N-6 adenine-specific, DNA methylase, adenine-specific [Septoria linicola]|uniref:DNA methylase, N-6 adenine-specific, DNA methylase, adenine-specific n=1 Tax=Septoria linicola TaxID=215465 RepID=A0A9Q9EHP6_9PEZI|nr:Putative DNA methylase, N-6 adenine-specific, DNA methylase, adenine-specific [Septoria linicola]